MRVIIREISTKRLLHALWAGVAVQLVGRAIDGRWHATHDGFETAQDQLQAHAVVWLGVLVTLVVSALARRHPGLTSSRAWLAVLVGSAGYVAVAVWHFIEHSQGDDPLLPHVLLVVTWALLLGGALAVTIAWRRASASSYTT